MKDFAKSIRTENQKVGNEDWSDLIRAAKKRLEDAKKFGWAETGYNGWTKKDVEDLEKKIKELEQKQRTGNSKVGNEYKPDIRITPADLSRNLKQAKNISEIDDIDDEIEYDLREYENAIDECKLKIKDYERSISALRMIQRDVSDARRNLK